RAAILACDPPRGRIVLSSAEAVTREAQLHRRNAEAGSPGRFGGASDAELVSRVLAGSDAAFAELVERYDDLLSRHAQRMLGRRDDAEDVVQAAWIRAHRRLRQCRDPERFGAWVFRIAANG